MVYNFIKIRNHTIGAFATDTWSKIWKDITFVQDSAVAHPNNSKTI